MSIHIKRLVSGSKARLKDDELGMELDLAYVTDQIIVMGFPATGLESIYRNRRTDVQRFLTTRHGQDFWVFNFCPITENTYDESVFQGRVSRYPFPDHHVPPFPYMSLVTKEIRTWLSGSDCRVAVLHCKAGKGRSGTMACAYILASSVSLTEQEMRSPRTLCVADLVPDCDGVVKPTSVTLDDAEVPQKQSDSTTEWTIVRTVSEPPRDTFEQVLDLYTSRRMKPAVLSVPVHKQRLGVSIPSQQRWLRYWSQFLSSGEHAMSRSPSCSGTLESGSALYRSSSRRVRLTRVVVRMRELSGVQPSLLQAVSLIKQTTNWNATEPASSGRIWVSVARYNDDLVDALESCEESCRLKSSEALSAFKSDKWDRGKMVRKFASMTTVDVQVRAEREMGRRMFTFTVMAPPSQGWTNIYTEEADDVRPRSTPPVSPLDSSAYSPSLSVTTGEDNSNEIIIHANRELRLKLFWGQVTLGWIWCIPAFHISPDSTTSTIVFTCSEIDFAVGMGKALVDVEVQLVWCTD
ncbi:hypothetical protein V8B97DRAFT_1973684 [Scleroderma yunnanense]